jgi:hypothetical protein
LPLRLTPLLSRVKFALVQLAKPSFRFLEEQANYNFTSL